MISIVTILSISLFRYDLLGHLDRHLDNFGIAGDGSQELKSVQIASQKVPRSSSAHHAKGIIEPDMDAVIVEKDVTVDLSNIMDGYLLIDYQGPYDRMGIDVSCMDANGVVHEMNSSINSDTDANVSNAHVTPYFSYPVGSGWQGYALPYGSGTYTIKARPYYSTQKCSHAKDIATFTFDANFEEVAPYQYRNAYSQYDENSISTSLATYLLSDAMEKKGRALTDKEKTEAIMTFVRANITQQSKANCSVFPDIESALTTGRGKCNERASAAAAMLKSQGVPVKIIHGYVLRNQDDKRIYHAWLNVYMDGKWAMYDPTAFDTEVADPLDNYFCVYLLDTAIAR
jgi:transglutaminase/protease-like cytokinesis protein 3